ncbi:thioredoxin family protein [Haloplasma contractile]|uniref:Thioredoxin-like protein YusE n=1 Tax=Haloplasma contractile SSD-17B TaxID=1033810 RepID=U2DXN4_9MOLU|nr:thioredoxin family protein [Haloplasma contractile]ERJ13007.1 Thioredoxin-like protein YusE [Haloplasma contractile SSD-17B]
MINDVSYDEFIQSIRNNQYVVMLGYANMCGTCEVAKKMLEVLSVNMSDITFNKINVNLNQLLIKEHDISSVPCFMLFKNGELFDTFYAFNSITFLYNRITSLKK